MIKITNRAIIILKVGNNINKRFIVYFLLVHFIYTFFINVINIYGIILCVEITGMN